MVIRYNKEFPDSQWTSIGNAGHVWRSFIQSKVWKLGHRHRLWVSPADYCTILVNELLGVGYCKSYLMLVVGYKLGSVYMCRITIAQ